jgi:hypothetical protein
MTLIMMSKTNRWPLIGTTLLLLAGGWYLAENYTLSQTSPSSQEILTTSNRTSPTVSASAGNVIMKVSLEPTSDVTQTRVRVVLDTHSENLDGVDFTTDFWLEKDGRQLKPLAATSEGENHHRQGVLIFDSVSRPFTVVGVNIADIPERKLVID